MTGRKRTIVVADDHPLLLRGVEDLLQSVGMFEVIEATESGVQALATIRSRKPDIALLDISMPDMSGMAILKAVRDEKWPVCVVFLTATLSGRQVSEAIALGVRGLLLKDYASETLVDCMKEVAAGRRWFPDDLIAKARSEGTDAGTPDIGALTPREREISGLVCRGLTNRAIANELGSSEGTVSIHLHNIYRKLDISSRTALTALMVQQRALGSGPDHR